MYRMLTPHDVETAEFPKRFFGGLVEDAVEDFREDVIRTLVGHIEENARLADQIAKLNLELEAYHAKERLVSQSVELAQKTHDQVVENAKREGEIIVREARLEEVRIRHEFAGLRAERDAFEFEFYGLLKGFTEKLERKSPQLRSLSSVRGSSDGEANAG